MNFRLVLLVFLIAQQVFSQSVFGKWITVDDETGEEKAIVEIYESNGITYGKIIDIFNPIDKIRKCTNCPRDLKNQPLIGLVIMCELKKDENAYEDGKIIDPKTGKEYRCYIELQNPNRLKVRGYIGFSILGRTQIWKRLKQ